MLNPLLLWFLPLALVPIVLHLITLYRVRTVELSTFRFLMESYLHQRRRLRFLEWLLMALRTAFVILIILMLSRPVVEGFNARFGGEAGRDVVIMIDASATMSLQQDGTTAIERARAAAKHVAELLNEDDHVTLIRAGHQPEVLRQGFASQVEPLLREIEGVNVDVTPADLPAAFAQIANAPKHGTRIIYLLTDAQQRTLSPLAQHPAIRQLDGDDRVVVMNFGGEDRVENLAVLGEPPHALRPIVGLPVLLRATVAAAGYEQPVDTQLSVVIEDEVVSQMNLTLEPGQLLTRHFVVTPREPGVLRGRFELPGDAFAEDNQYLFTLNVEPELKVLLVTPANLARADDPRVYLGAALRAPQRLADEFASAERQISASLAIDHVSEDRLSRVHLDRADVVIAADILIDQRLGEMLHQFVSAGGGLMLMPGPRPDVLDYNVNLLGSTLHERRAVALREATGDVDDEANFQSIDQLDTSHPILSVFENTQPAGESSGQSGGGFSTVRLFRHFPIAVADPVEGYPRVLMRLSDGTPVLTETRLGAGRVLTTGFTATPAWSNLPLKPEFVPIMLRSVAHLRRPAEVATPSTVRPHEPAPIQLSERYAGGSVDLLGPEARLHAVEIHRADRGLVGATDRTAGKGYYTFQVNPPSGAADRSTREVGFAVNLDLPGAAFDSLDGDAVTDLFAPAEVVYLRSSPTDPMLAEQLQQRQEMWRTLIWITFGLIALEFMLSTLRGGPVGDGSDRPGGLRGMRRRMAGRLDRTFGLNRESAGSSHD
ncbi:MAG: BatA domain-containing protein [Phycisphaeraceae bacterium]